MEPSVAVASRQDGWAKWDDSCTCPLSDHNSLRQSFLQLPCPCADCFHSLVDRAVNKGQRHAKVEPIRRRHAAAYRFRRNELGESPTSALRALKLSNLTFPTQPVSSHYPQESYLFKRNYTFHAVDGTEADDNGPTSYYFWDASALRYTSPARKTLAYPTEPWKNVVCATNIFGQTDFYKEPKMGSGPTFNAYCLRGPMTTSELLPMNQK